LITNTKCDQAKRKRREAREAAAEAADRQSQSAPASPAPGSRPASVKEGRAASLPAVGGGGGGEAKVGEIKGGNETEEEEGNDDDEEEEEKEAAEAQAWGAAKRHLALVKAKLAIADLKPARARVFVSGVYEALVVQVK